MNTIINKFEDLELEDKTIDKIELENKTFEKLELEDKICGICACVKENEVILSCNHSYCYDCIYDWFKVKRIKKTFNDRDGILLECPYCKQKVNKIPLLEKYVYIRGITNPKQINEIQLNKKNKSKNNIIPKNNNNLLICNAPIKSQNNTLCQTKGKECYGYYCGKHKKYQNLIPKVNNN